ncbi:MAG TPA: energy transducer TonB [Candidatus Saccharimonadaceae bacterium]|jgi:TonB family protein|nr:energy transducer TonB [Candidatus Saccharimonadaceae bacterium]
MIHGSHEYFAERARFERRVSFLTLGLSLLGYALLFLLTRSPIGESLRRTDVLEHFGFEGPERFVERVELQSSGGVFGASAIPLNAVAVPDARRGGQRGRSTPHAEHAPPKRPSGFEGPGDAPNDLLARALRRAGNTPVFQSEELVVEQLVRPVYPEEARDRGIEGHVALMALVDTLGRVVDVELVNGEDSGLLERASAEAVWRCRFRPYRVGGVPREVYAVFRFAFRLTDR